MLEMLRKRLSRDEEGFTLIELMVVVLIIAILIAIAIPTFLGARERAQDRAAQSDIRNGFTAEKVYFTDNEAYTETSADLNAIEPSLTFSNATTVTADSVHVDWNDTSDTLIVAKKSASGECFYLKDIATGTSAGTTYASDTGCSLSGTLTWNSEW